MASPSAVGLLLVISLAAVSAVPTDTVGRLGDGSSLHQAHLLQKLGVVKCKKGSVACPLGKHYMSPGTAYSRIVGGEKNISKLMKVVSTEITTKPLKVNLRVAPGKQKVQLGPPGKKGPPGMKGNFGPIGFPGVRGKRGSTGVQGVVGRKGRRGPRGARGVGGEVVKGMTGRVGKSGPTGKAGSNGHTGQMGRPGFPGTPGHVGAKGREGSPGLPGVNGRPGKNGHAGRRGATGKRGARGKRGPVGLRGGRGQRGPRGNAVASLDGDRVVSSFHSTWRMYRRIKRGLQGLKRMRAKLIKKLALAQRRYKREQEEKRKRAAVLRAAKIAAASKLKKEQAAAEKRRKKREAKRKALEAKRRAAARQRAQRSKRIAAMKALQKAKHARLHGMFEIRALSADKCLSISQASARAGSRIILQKCHRYRHQVFMWIKDQLTSVLNGLCVSIKGGSMKDGAQLVMQRCQRFKAQRWDLTKKGYLKSRLHLKCADLYARRKATGTPVVIWPCHGGNNQVFALRRIAVARQVPLPGYRFRSWCKSITYRKKNVAQCFKMGRGWVWVGLCKKWWFRRQHIEFCTPKKPCAKCKYGIKKPTVKKVSKKMAKKIKKAKKILKRVSRRRRRVIQKIVKKILKKPLPLSRPCSRGKPCQANRKQHPHRRTRSKVRVRSSRPRRSRRRFSRRRHRRRHKRRTRRNRIKIRRGRSRRNRRTRVQIRRGRSRRNRRTRVQIRRGHKGAAKCRSRLVSFHKKARQSSTTHGGSASRAVDGNTNGRYARGSCTHTARTKRPWWRVDLRKMRRVRKVVVWNRQDCCSSRLNHFIVSVSARRVWSTCGRVAHAKRKNTIECGCRRARFVKVQLQRTAHLTLCEVQVFGS